MTWYEVERIEKQCRDDAVVEFHGAERGAKDVWWVKLRYRHTDSHWFDGWLSTEEPIIATTYIHTCAMVERRRCEDKGANDA